MKKKCFIVTTLLIILAVLTVSCTAETAEDSHAVIKFSELTDRGINENIYSMDAACNISSSIEDIASADIFWSYRAVKTDNGFDYGSTDKLVPLIEGENGRGFERLLEFSRGTWKFELKGYVDSTDRINEVNAVYSASTEVEVSASYENISIALDRENSEGYGTVSFNIKVSLAQEEIKNTKTYKISKVRVCVGEQSLDITGIDSDGVYKGEIAGVSSGKQTAGYEIYIDDEELPRVISEEEIVVMNGLTTEVDGNASLTLSGVLRTITYDYDGGSLPKNTVNPKSGYAGEVITPVAPIKDGYVFNGWKSEDSADSTASDSYVIQAEDVTLRAVWEKEYTITYDLAGGTVSNANPMTYNSSTKRIMLNTPEREGYIFAGWSLNGGEVIKKKAWNVTTGNLVFKAVWALTEFYISYNLNGGTAEGNPYSYTNETDSITLNTPTREGYTFEGWVLNDSRPSKESVWSMTGGDLLFTAVWSANKYNISYELDGGSLSISNPTTYTLDDKSVTLNTPSRTGYTFTGWSLNGGDVSQEDTWNVITGGMNFNANWEVNTYTITFDSNGGDEIADSSYTYGVSQKLPTARRTPTITSTVANVEPTARTFKRAAVITTTTSYTFVGWKIAGTEDSETYTTIPAGFYGDIELEAVWSRSAETEQKGGEFVYKNMTVGTVINLGKIPASDTAYGGQDIAWRVIAAEKGRVLLLSEMVLYEASIDTKEYSDYTITKDGTITGCSYVYKWSEADINEWLNSTFIEDYGLSDLPYLNIEKTTESGPETEEETTDEAFFLLSLAEVEEYLSADSRKAAWLNGDAAYWWVRTPGTKSTSAVACVGEDGTTVPAGVYVSEPWKNGKTTGVGIRPAFWLKVGDYDASPYDAYEVGSTGPSGGWILYDAGSMQTSKYIDIYGKEQTYTWRFLEVAESNVVYEFAVDPLPCFGYYREAPESTRAVCYKADITDDDTGSSAIGEGRYNTTMLAYKMNGKAYTELSSKYVTTTDRFSTKLCVEYRGAGYDDWFLPSIQELKLIKNLDDKGIGNFVKTVYWSSTEYSDKFAWTYSLRTDETTGLERDGWYGILPVRAF